MESETRHLGGSVQQPGGDAVLLVIEVRRRAYLYAKAKRRVYVELPDGDGGGPAVWAAEKELGQHP